jgi:hypothetical protein
LKANILSQELIASMFRVEEKAAREIGERDRVKRMRSNGAESGPYPEDGGNTLFCNLNNLPEYTASHLRRW